MIEFKTVRFKNFFSFGNVFSEIDLRKYGKTLVQGENGKGKSVGTTDAICFALYGRPYKSVNKIQVINSINQKNCEVQIEFKIGTDEYRVIRGIKPNKFEIFKNDKLVEQEAALADYQGYLERQVLKINFKTFCQVVVVGSANFTPFMQLSVSQRRDVVEDILDIAVFGKMNDILKGRIADSKQRERDIAYQIDLSKKHIEAQQKIIRILESAKEVRVREEEEAIAQLEVSISKLTGDINTLMANRFPVAPLFPCSSKLRELEAMRSGAISEIASLKKTSEKIGTITSCPTCLQGVSDHHHAKIEEEISKKIDLKKVALAEFEEDILALESQKKLYDAQRQSNDEVNLSISLLENELETARNLIEKKRVIITGILKNQKDIAAERDLLRSLATSGMGYAKEKKSLLDERELQDQCSLLLKDSGIKAAIVREYIPILNKLTNKYLGVFGFFVNFSLDENFDEKILSRNRDQFSYNSFSEGEKRRIDTAILFAFRHISEMKNSANCNILVLDEVIDSSFDLIARECFMDMLSSLENVHSFVISHTAPSHEAFDAVLTFKKVGDFSTFEYLT